MRPRTFHGKRFKIINEYRETGEDQMSEIEPIIIDESSFLYHHCALPPLPAVVNRLKDIMCSKEINVSEVSNLVKTDPALVAQILKIVNSAYYSFPREIVEISFAIAYLGINEVYRTVLSLSVINTLDLNDSANFNKFWFHSNYTALLTKFITEKYAPFLPLEKLWSAAMLHDIGKLIYLKFFPKHFNILIKYCETQGELFSHAEKHFSLPSSAFFGKLLCERWRLPGRIKDACKAHSLDDLKKIKGESATDDFIRMISIGNLTAVLAENNLKEELKELVSSQIRTSLNLSSEEFLVLMEDVNAFKQKVYQLMP